MQYGTWTYMPILFNLITLFFEAYYMITQQLRFYKGYGKKLLTDISDKHIIYLADYFNICGYGGIGRRARFRF